MNSEAISHEISLCQEITGPLRKFESSTRGMKRASRYVGPTRQGPTRGIANHAITEYTCSDPYFVQKGSRRIAPSVLAVCQKAFAA
jgi:hypothetical protein